MADLPSRATAKAMLDGKLHEDDGALVVADLLRLAASGRLVDRETIDYEAAQQEAISYAKKDDAEDWWRLVADAVVAAAIGDTG